MDETPIGGNQNRGENYLQVDRDEPAQVRLNARRVTALAAPACYARWRRDAEGTLRERGHRRPRAVTELRVIPSACAAFVPSASRPCPRFPPRRSMVRRGSTVRVRQRALNDLQTAVSCCLRWLASREGVGAVSTSRSFAGLSRSNLFRVMLQDTARSHQGRPHSHIVQLGLPLRARRIAAANTQALAAIGQ